MNARLQVEHPITELVTGLDLVHLQLAVAAGEPLPFSQEDIASRGAAIEARVYAEDPYTGLPAGGKLQAFGPPAGPGIRNDVGVETGDEVTLDYDPMLGKLIVSGPDRTTAVLRLRRALEDYAVLGVTTNLPLLRSIADVPAFAAGETTTGFIEEHSLDEPAQEPSPPREALLLAADGETSVVEVLYIGDGRIRAAVDERILEGGFASEGRNTWLSLGPSVWCLERPDAPDVDGAMARTEAGDGASLTAPMPGTVVEVFVGEGDEVEEGQTLLVLEAMKMEQSMAAPHAGMVKALPYAEGARVPGGAVLAELEESGES